MRRAERCPNGTHFAPGHMPADDGRMCLACGLNLGATMSDELLAAAERLRGNWYDAYGATEEGLPDRLIDDVLLCAGSCGDLLAERGRLRDDLSRLISVAITVERQNTREFLDYVGSVINDAATTLGDKDKVAVHRSGERFEIIRHVEPDAAYMAEQRYDDDYDPRG
jgi:hypothetical protein